MAKTLVLAEKPSVGRELARVLGASRGGEGYLENGQYIVTWALGHLVTLADPEDYDAKYKTWNMEDLPMLPEKRKLEKGHPAPVRSGRYADAFYSLQPNTQEFHPDHF